MKKIKPFHLSIIVIAAAVLAWLNPLGMEMSQRMILSGLICAAGMWATEAVHKTVACVFLLLIFFLFGKTEPVSILSFAWSNTLLLIVTTTWLSVGMMKTGMIQKLVEKLFEKCASSMWKLLMIPYLFGVVLVFIIPQAFARVIIIGTIFGSLLRADGESKQARQALIFNGFIAVTMTYMFFSNGDIVLNQGAVRFAGEGMDRLLTFQRWFVMMSVPTLVTCVVSMGLVYLLFKKELRSFRAEMMEEKSDDGKALPRWKQVLGMASMLVIIAFWMTERVHGIAPWMVAAVGCLVMFATGILEKADVKAVNPHFLIFLLTIFNIGKVLGESGITSAIFEQLSRWIPNVDSSLYLLMIAGVVMMLHLCIGSSMATLSVVLPILLPLTGSVGYRPEMITLIAYIVVNIHFLLPFHHATVMIGTAREYYPDRYMLRFGSVMTVVTFLLLACCYFPWWRILGIL